MTENEKENPETRESAAEMNRRFVSELKSMASECPEAFGMLKDTLRKCGWRTASDVPIAARPCVRTWYALYRKGVSL
jgi:hypothetical protein